MADRQFKTILNSEDEDSLLVDIAQSLTNNGKTVPMVTDKLAEIVDS